MNDDTFIRRNSHKTIDFKPKFAKPIKALPVGSYLLVGPGYTIYNRELKVPLLDCVFQSIIDAHEFCNRLIEIYGDLLHILVDEDYADSFFKLTQYTVENGETIFKKVVSLEGIITRDNLDWILD